MILDELLYKYKGITINAIRKAKNGEDINEDIKDLWHETYEKAKYQ